LRFLVDSEVIVLVNKDYLGAPLIKQMVGRSSRRTGLCYGTVFITTEYELGNSQDGAEATQHAREDLYDQDDGQMIVGAFFNKVPLLQASQKVSLKEIVGKAPKWRTTREEFSKNKNLLLKFLTDSDFIPNDNVW
jgi:hypothetical protein